MKITDVTVVRLQGVLESEGEFWEERLVRPLDIYPEHKAEGPHEMFAVGEGRYNITAYFVEVGTDEGVSGRGGPLPLEQAFIIQTQLAPLLIGHDPLATERLWDRMYRSQVHGRKGTEMMALSAVDCALWDLKGNYFQAPVC